MVACSLLYYHIARYIYMYVMYLSMCIFIWLCR